MNDTPNVLVRLKYYPSTGNNKQFANSRAYYSSSLTDDYMRYIDKGAEEENPAPDYVDYVGNREKSTGVFGKGGLLTKDQKAEIRKALRTTDSVIWDMVISFESKYGDKHLTGTEAAQGLLNAQLNRFFKRVGLNPGNMAWFAGVHTNTDNAHIHLSFFEREPLSIRQKDKTPHYHNGKLRQIGIDGFKISIEQYFSDTATRIKAARKELTTAVDTAFRSAAFNKTLKSSLLKIASVLPPTGRIGYDSENMEAVRPLADKLTAYILKANSPVSKTYTALKYFLNKHDDETRTACRKQRIKNVDDYLMTDKIVRDLYRRLGNKAIAAALNICKARNDERQAIKRNSVQRRIARRELFWTIMEGLKLGAVYEAECNLAFSEYLKRLENAREEQYERSEYEM
jgi:hypothetical protein